jgi:hypothetical protein
LGMRKNAVKRKNIPKLPLTLVLNAYFVINAPMM